MTGEIMKSEKNIEKLIGKINVTPDAQKDRKALEQILHAQEKTKTTSSANIKPNTWRLNMKNKMIKLTTAAVLIVAVFIGVNHLGGSVDIAGVAWGHTMKAMKEMPWVHVIAKVDTIEQKGQTDAWISFHPYIMVLKESDGNIYYTDLNGEIKYDYNLFENTITISAVPDISKTMGPKSHFNLLEHMIGNLEAGDAEITREESVLDMKPVEIIHSASNTQDVLIVRDIERNLVVSAEYETFADTPEQGTIVMRFEYPQGGPADIYAAGAARDAKVIDLRPKGDVGELILELKQRFNNGFGDHRVVVLESSSLRQDRENLYPKMMVIRHQKNELKRMDCYFAADDSERKRKNITSLYEKVKDDWPNLTLEQVLSLEDDRALQVQALFDGKHSFGWYIASGEVKKSKSSRDSFAFSPNNLSSIVWGNPFMLTVGRRSELKTIEPLPSDPGHSHLLGFRVRTIAKNNNKKYDSRNEPNTGIDDYWFDPEKDYIMVEHISRKQALRRPTIISSNTIVKETSQTVDGRWYPKVIYREYVKVNSKGEERKGLEEKRLLLVTNPVFKEGLFDSSSLME
jgi:hypothetical protein